VLRLIRRIDDALGHPDPFDVVDVGAGRGELLTTLRSLLGAEPDQPGAGPGGSRTTPARPTQRRVHSLRKRVRWVGVELAGRPAGLASAIGWRREVPDGVLGLLLATEWLDNVPLDLAELDDAGRVRRVVVDTASGVESLAGLVDAAEAFWLARWWPGLHAAGDRAEIGWTRDLAWADAVSSVQRGCALAVDYGHLRTERPRWGTLTGFRGGRQIQPVPDGSCDITAHVAIDSAAAGAGSAYEIRSQRDALRALGVDGRRPPLGLASTDPAAYLRALGAAGAAAELIDPAGLGGHWWLLHSIGVSVSLA
jgi:SAM-dependent MidA family methyltransferase